MRCPKCGARFVGQVDLLVAWECQGCGHYIDQDKCLEARKKAGLFGKGKMTLREAVAKEHETYRRLKDEIEEGRRNEASYWKFLDEDDSDSG